MRKTTLLSLLLLCCGISQAQVSLYSFSQSTESYVPVVGTISTANGDDGSQSNLPIGFDFNFSGIDYNTISINVNGWVRLGNPILNQSWVNQLGNSVGTAPLIAPYWDDHNRNAGTIAYSLTGLAPNRILEVGWDNINISTGGATNDSAFGSFKMRLHETTGIIEFVYGSLVPGGQLSASVGLNDASSFLSVTPGLPVASAVSPNNNVNNIMVLTGQRLTFTPPAPCMGAPDPGNTVSTLTSVCENMPFTLGLQNDVNGIGIGYQWQSSTDGVNFGNILNQNAPILEMTQTVTTYYQCVVSCGAESTISTPIEIVQNDPLQCYCIPSYTNGVTDGDLISNVVIEGTTLSNFTGAVPSGASYTYFSGQPNYTATLQAGVAYTIAVTVGTFGQQEIAVWIDYNDDAVFSDDEKIGFTTEQIGGGGTGTFAIELGCDLPPGTHRMRIRDAWNTNAETMEPCINYGYGETEDYDITVLPSTGCQRPEGLSADGVSSSSAVLGWDFGCGHITWDVHVTGHGGGLPTGEPSNPDVAIGLVVSDLDADTGYEFFVRAHCDGDEVSDWAGPFDFTTLPVGVSNDDCQTATPLVPGGNFAEHAVVANNIAATATVGQPAPTCGTFNFGGDVWFSVVVPESGSVTLEVQSDPGSPVADTAMTAFTGDCTNLTALGCSDDEGIGAFSMLNLTGLTPGEIVYARVWEYANDTFGSFQVSAWDPTLSTRKFEADDFKYYPNPVKDMLHLSYSTAITAVAIYNLVGQQVLSKTIGSAQGEVDLSHLSSGPYVVKVTAENQTQTIKIIKE